MRIAFSGASGTGKTKLAEHVFAKLDIRFNPVGSRSAARDMGFDNPYHVDSSGCREEFQSKLLFEKNKWEEAHESFVTDRTVVDNLAYTSLHGIHSINDKVIELVMYGMRRYTHVVYCPVDVFCNVGQDPIRVKNMQYHRIFDMLIGAMLHKYMASETKLLVLGTSNFKERCEWVDSFIAPAI